MKPFARLGLALAIGAASLSAQADPCAGFIDVNSASAFCPSVEWLRNRAVTTGCAIPNSYCPDDPVSRLAMAAFMKRLGAALTPIPVVAEGPTGALDIDTLPVVCVTNAFAVAGFPRRAYVDASVSATAVSSLDFGAAIVSSTDGGATWGAVAGDIRAAVLSNRWGHASAIGYVDLDVSQSVVFGVRLSRADGGAVDPSDARCSLRATISNRDGATSPF